MRSIYVASTKGQAMSIGDVVLVSHRYLDVGGVRIFYRDAGPADAPTMLLLHGFPSASHQFRRLIDALGSTYRLIAPDYPGFGHSDPPPPGPYTFDTMADLMERFVDGLGIECFTPYLFDFGGPVGFRLAEHQPDRIAGLVIQNANAYEEGLSEAARDFISLRRENPGAKERLLALMTLEGTRGQYLTGTRDPDAVPPDGWTLDQHFLDLPGRKDIQADLLFDYKRNVERYAAWQAWLRAQRPPALIVWGRSDPFFTAAGAEAYLRDLPNAELHLFDAGHFALEDMLPAIAPLIARFLDRTWDERGRPSPRA